MRKISRLKRKILSEWKPINLSDSVQVITDAMASNSKIQINYDGSGWRLIEPYGWNSSKDQNVLLMCYKDTGEVRSYRLDKILEVLVDDSMLSSNQRSNEIYQIEDYKVNPSDFEIPTLPNQEEVLQLSEQEPGNELPYDEGLNILTSPELVNEDLQNTIDVQENEQGEENERQTL